MTTMKAVQDAFEQLLAQDDIYLASIAVGIPLATKNSSLKANWLKYDADGNVTIEDLIW